MTPAYILHSRAYRETSLLLELFTLEHGRVAAIARGAKRKNSPWNGALSAFLPLCIQLVGKGDLLTLTLAEASDSLAPPALVGTSLVCGLYINELLLRTLQRNAPVPDIFILYQQTLNDLKKTKHLDITLRTFEKKLLMHLGYALNLKTEAESSNAIQPDQHYQWIHSHGLSQTQQSMPGNTSIFLGRHLLAFENDDYQDPQTRQAAKRLMRLALQPLLGDRALKTRELLTPAFRQKKG